MEEGTQVEAGVGVTRRAVLGSAGRGFLAVVGAGLLGTAMPAPEALARQRCGRKDDDEARRQCRSKRRAKRGRR